MEYTCLINFFDDNGDRYEKNDDNISLFIDGDPLETKWIFRKNQIWEEYQKVINYDNFSSGWKFENIGKWRCNGDFNFIVENTKTKKIYNSADDTPIWKEISQVEQPEVESTATQELTYDRSKFPLKLDSRGSEVVQLQNYLNTVIPFEPLVVNGIFDKKTQDKLIQLQKTLNLAK